MTLLLEDELDISRGDMICRPHNQPHADAATSRRWSAGWPTSRCGRGGGYALKHTTRTCRAVVDELRYRVDVNTLHRDEDATAARASTTSGACTCAPARRCWSTSTARNRATGSFILIDEATNFTVGAGLILGTDI